MTSESINQSNSKQLSLFEQLPEYLIGYILTYFTDASDFIKMYDLIQGKISNDDECLPMSRSNLIFSKNNELAIKSIDFFVLRQLELGHYQTFINITNLQIYMSKCDSQTLVLILSSLNQLERFSLENLELETKLSSDVTVSIGKSDRLEYVKLDINDFENPHDLIPALTKLIHLRFDKFLYSFYLFLSFL
jgi:hypothetical protein